MLSVVMLTYVMLNVIALFPWLNSFGTKSYIIDVQFSNFDFIYLETYLRGSLAPSIQIVGSSLRTKLRKINMLKCIYFADSTM